MPIKKAHIKGYGGKYSVSSSGKVFSNGKQMATRKDKNEYPRVNLRHGKISTTVRVHSLVAKHFKLKGKRNQNQVGHMNGDKSDPSLRNLQMQSPSENSQHSHDTGLYGRYTVGNGVVRQHLRKGKNKVSVIKKHKRKK